MNFNRESISPKQLESVRIATEHAVHYSDLTALGYIGFIGTGITTGRFVHDIDILVFPKPGVLLGQAIKSMNVFYRTIDDVLRKDSHLYLATCPRKIMQAEVNYIIGSQNGFSQKISVHTLFFSDEERFVRLNPKSFAEDIYKQNLCLHGSLTVLSSLVPIADFSEDYLWLLDYQISLVAKTYPLSLLRQKTVELHDRFKKYHGFTGPLCIKTRIDCIALANDLLNLVDEKHLL
ncbi:MAG: hypothetical protein WC916_05450 [Candidatus Woesearchaeota archaeon]